MNALWSLCLSCCHLLNSENILSHLPCLTKKKKKQLWHFQFISIALSLSICPCKAKHCSDPEVLLTVGHQLGSCFSSLNQEIRKIYPHHINPSNLRCHQINSSSPRWLQRKCWLPCPSQSWTVHVPEFPLKRQSYKQAVLSACLHYHIFLSSVSSHYSVLSALISPWSLWDPQHPHLQK